MITELLRMATGARPVRLLPLDSRYIAEYVARCRDRGLDRQSCNQEQRHLDDWARLIGPRIPR